MGALTAWLFAGQGSQRKGMGGPLFERFPDACAAADAILGYSIRELCLDNPGGRLGDTTYAQPAIYVVGVLGALEAAADPQATPPAFIAGHSVGEYAALVASGALDFETGLRLVRRRGELMGHARGGGMVAVLDVPVERIEEVLAAEGVTELDLANYNLRRQVVLSGPKRALPPAIAALERAGARCVQLDVSAAFHSRYMAEAAAEFAPMVEAAAFGEPEVPVLSNVTAEPYRRAEIGALLARQLRAPVRWYDCMRALRAGGVTEVRELGRTRVLSELWRSYLRDEPDTQAAAATSPATVAAALPPIAPIARARAGAASPATASVARARTASSELSPPAAGVARARTASSELSPPAASVARARTASSELSPATASAPRPRSASVPPPPAAGVRTGTPAIIRGRPTSVPPPPAVARTRTATSPPAPTSQGPAADKAATEAAVAASAPSASPAPAAPAAPQSALVGVQTRPVAGARPGRGPEHLGSAEFCRDHGVRYPYLAGSMFRGISSPEMVVRLARAGLMGFLGTGGLEPTEIDAALRRVRAELGPQGRFGANLLHQLGDEAQELALVELFHDHGVRCIEASAFTQITPALVVHRFRGARIEPSGRLVVPNRIVAKVSRPELAAAFMAPAPTELVMRLLAKDALSPIEAEAARRLPLAQDLTVEADSAGHSDGGVSLALLPMMTRLRDEAMARHGYQDRVRVGAAGGLGTPEAVAAAFVLGADFVVTGSINQCTPEAGTSAGVKELLAALDVPDTGYAPAGDMFELGARVQVVRKGTLFAARGNQLYQLYRQHDSLGAIDVRTRNTIESAWFHRSFDDIWHDTRDYFARRQRPDVVEVAERDPKQRMALVFRWYFARSISAALAGEPTERVNYQIHCGPAMGAFNRLVRGTSLEPWHARNVDTIAELLMQGAADVLRGAGGAR